MNVGRGSVKAIEKARNESKETVYIEQRAIIENVGENDGGVTGARRYQYRGGLNILCCPSPKAKEKRKGKWRRKMSDKLHERRGKTKIIIWFYDASREAAWSERPWENFLTGILPREKARQKEARLCVSRHHDHNLLRRLSIVATNL